MAIQTKTSPSAVAEVQSSDANDKYYPFFNTSPNEDFALNAIGTAKVMCRCNGTPVFMKKVRSLEDIKDHGRLCLRRNSSRSQRKDAIQPSKGGETLFDANTQTASPTCEGNTNETEQVPESQLVCQKRSATNSDALSNLEKQKTPFSFSVFWSSIKNGNDLPAVAKALRILCPEEIMQGISKFLHAHASGIQV